MKYIQVLILSFSLLFMGSLVAQSSITVTGKVIEQATSEPIYFATVVLQDGDGKFIANTDSDENGMFSLTSSVEDFTVEISLVGFQSAIIDEYEIANGYVDLGTIPLDNDGKMMEEVVINAEKSTTEFKLDKRVFNVGQDLKNAGAGVLEVLNNVPSVNVNIEGEISLRGNTGVQILIDGKPSVLASDQSNALGSITAEMIEKVEVITNPSAKYEAEGTSGIINIVIKKDEKQGTNGSISVNTGIPDNHSIGFSINRRANKFNLFSQLGIGYRSLPRHRKDTIANYALNRILTSSGTEYRNETFYTVRLGTDYYINPLNVITLSGNFAYEVESQPSENKFIETTTNITEWTRTEETSAWNPKWSYELNYSKKFEDSKKHKLNISALGNFFGKDQESDFLDLTTVGLRSNTKQKTATNFKEAKYTFKLDYEKPLSKAVCIEAGGQYVLQDVSNDFEVQNLIDDTWVNDVNQTNLFEYKQDVLGLYTTGAYEGEKWGVKAGARVEYTDLNTELVNTQEKNNQQYTNLFPSLHTSYKLSDRVSLQAGYSRRIYRPRLWDLNPFFNIRNNFSIWSGNPALEPEYSDSYELTSIFIFDKLSLNVGLYHLYTTDVIERIALFDNFVNRTQPENIGTKATNGLEFNTKYNLTKAITLTADANYGQFSRKGTFQEQNFDFIADVFNTKGSVKVKLPKDWTLEISGNHRSKQQTIQGESLSSTHMDVGILKKINKGKTIINFSIRDVFGTRRYASIIDNRPDYYLTRTSRRGTFYRLSISYNFGKGEAMQYSGRRRF